VNGDPYRTPPQSGGRVINRSGAAGPVPPTTQSRQTDDMPLPQQVPENRQLRAASAVPAQKKQKLSAWIIALGAALIVAVATVGWVLYSSTHGATGIDTNKYQAVSFADGQLYFGKLQRVSRDYFTLSEVYYLQPQTADAAQADTVQNATTNQNNFKLIKFSDVIYGPEDKMMIPKEQILFYENISSSGKVAQLIKQFKK